MPPEAVHGAAFGRLPNVASLTRPAHLASQNTRRGNRLRASRHGAAAVDWVGHATDMRQPGAELWELAALAAKGEYEEYKLRLPQGKTLLNSMGALDLKLGDKGSLERYECRLVARGDG